MPNKMLQLTFSTVPFLCMPLAFLAQKHHTTKSRWARRSGCRKI